MGLEEGCSPPLLVGEGTVSLATGDDLEVPDDGTIEMWVELGQLHDRPISMMTWHPVDVAEGSGHLDVDIPDTTARGEYAIGGLDSEPSEVGAVELVTEAP